MEQEANLSLLQLEEVLVSVLEAIGRVDDILQSISHE